MWMSVELFITCANEVNIYLHLKLKSWECSMHSFIEMANKLCHDFIHRLKFIKSEHDTSLCYMHSAHGIHSAKVFIVIPLGGVLDIWLLIPLNFMLLYLLFVYNSFGMSFHEEKVSKKAHVYILLNWKWWLVVLSTYTWMKYHNMIRRMVMKKR